jgi:hypothetical protein
MQEAIQWIFLFSLSLIKFLFSEEKKIFISSYCPILKLCPMMAAILEFRQLQSISEQYPFFCHQTGMVGHWILRLYTFYESTHVG